MPKHARAAPQSFLPPFKENSEAFFFLPLAPTVSSPIDASWYSFTFISAAHEPEMIYAVPLTSLSPSPLAPASSLLSPPSPLCVPAAHLPSSPLCFPLSPLRRALCPMGIRVAQQTTSAMARRGKLMRRSSWRTMWGTFRTPLNV